MRLLSTTALAVVSSCVAAPMLADCLTDDTNGPIITCIGPSDPINDDRDGVRVLFPDDSPGEIVVGAEDAIRLRGQDSEVYLGEGSRLVSQESDGIDGGSGLIVNMNGAVIEAGNRGIDADDLDGVDVTMIGSSLTAAEKGIRVGDGDLARFFLDRSVISSGDEGIEAGDDAFGVFFDSQIVAEEDVVQVGESGELYFVGTSLESIGEDGDGIDIDSGYLEFQESDVFSAAPTGAGIDIDGDAEGKTTIFIGQDSSIVGNTGILVEKGLDGDPANLERQEIYLGGLLEGFGGVAADLGAGEDHLWLADGSQVIGDVLFGIDDDQLVFGVESLSNIFRADSLLDGGDGIDEIYFPYLSFDNVVSELRDTAIFGYDGEVLSVEVGTNFSAEVTGFETVSFSDGRRSFNSVVSALGIDGVTPVPLPATALLLLAGFGCLGAARRRRA